MSASRHFDSGTGNSPAEKSKFAQTCSRLSLFLKQKGTIRDLNLGINAKFDSTGVSQNSPAAEATTADLLSNIDDLKAEKSANINIPPFPTYVILDSSSELQNSINKDSSSKPVVTKPKTAQMTIFYGGQVVVVDDVPVDRARDLMKMANNGQPVDPKVENRVEIASTSKLKSKSPSGEAAKDSDLPIARRASLHKFLAKRRDRATVRAPYQLDNHQSPGGSSSGNDHSFDLNM